MHRNFFQLLIFAFCSFCYVSCGEQNNVLKQVIRLDSYPSASAIEYYNDQFYVIGDDANYLLILDSNLSVRDSIRLYQYREKRIPKAWKPDLEAICIIRRDSRNKLLMTGSGSLAPMRNNAVIYDPYSRQLDSLRLDTLYNSFLLSGLKELNIEGACSTPNYLIFANRGHLGYRHNHLLFVNNRTVFDHQQLQPQVVSVGGNTDTSSFQGISGLAYAPRGDRLIMTVSTEATSSTLEDGAIGKSYLWIIRNISSRRGWKAVNPDQVIDLEQIDPVFRGQKIESVCITGETNSFLHLVLAADNDNGSSTLFRVVIEKK